jgi:hypothetical protein
MRKRVPKLLPMGVVRWIEPTNRLWQWLRQWLRRGGSAP